MGCLDLSSLPVPGFPGTGSGEPPPPPPPYVSQVCYLDAGAANDLEWSRVRPAGGAVFNVGFFQKLVAGEHLLCRPEPRVGTY